MRWSISSARVWMVAPGGGMQQAAGYLQYAMDRTRELSLFPYADRWPSRCLIVWSIFLRGYPSGSEAVTDENSDG